MICEKCKEDLGEGIGLFGQVEHFSVCPENKPIRYSNKITKKDIENFFKKIQNKPREYRGSTICGMGWVSDERYIIATCERESCIPCREFDELLIENYGSK